MQNNTTISLGAIVMIHQIENRYGLFKNLFSDIGIKTKQFIPLVKLLVGNKLTHAVSIRQIPETYPVEFSRQLGMNEPLAERTLYRTLEPCDRHWCERVGGAWTTTSGLSDGVDTYIEILHPLNRTKYLFNHQWLLMERRIETIYDVNGTPHEFECLRTVHGPVLAVGWTRLLGGFAVS